MSYQNKWINVCECIYREWTQEKKIENSVKNVANLGDWNTSIRTLYKRQQKRHRCIEQSFGLCGRGQGWDDLGKWHWNMYNIICETNCQSRFDAWYRMLGAGALGWPRGMVWEGRWEGGSGWGTHVHPWLIRVNVWQNPLQYCKVISL